MVDYCDTNILTAFVNRRRLSYVFGSFGFNKHKDKIRSSGKDSSEIKAIKFKKCIISRDALLSDIGQHQPSLGAVLTSAGLNNIDVKKIDGLSEGKKVFNEACSKEDENSYFYKKFCNNKKIKDNLDYNNQNYIIHFGSAIKENSERFITSNVKDFKPLEKYSKIKITWQIGINPICLTFLKVITVIK